ncbi:prephenate dehydratase [Gorillibacterium massiliense]|uniref:prephenate dehydratase n=1 Tax=Gorillibacterium massiliense TaxID=1280390 RepID=UPI0004AF751F|nr:prephenate dehydratase [Gorillibacterium massiliense]
MKRVAFLGPAGTVSEEATRFFFQQQDDKYEFVPYSHISEVFLATDSGETDWSVIPIENAIDGSVSLHLDWLIHEMNLPILTEWTYPSIQNLIGRKSSDEGKSYAGIRKLIAFPVASGQCRKFLRSELPNVEIDVVNSTAEGVRLAAASGDPSIASIGTRLAAERYGLDLLAENITDHDNNYTRFVLVGREQPALPGGVSSSKTTLIVTLPEDFPGALHQVLSTFAWRRINMTKIESRPTKLKLGTYYFYIDVEMAMDSVLMTAAIAEVEALGCQVRVLGSYPTYAYETAGI